MLTAGIVAQATETGPPDKEMLKRLSYIPVR